MRPGHERGRGAFGRLASCGIFFALCAAVPQAAIAQKRTLSQADWKGASVVAESVVDHYARRDWRGLSKLASADEAPDWSAKLASLDASLRQMGNFEHAVLAEEIFEVADGCHAWRYAVAHAKHNAVLRFQLCGADDTWTLAFLHVVVSLDALAHTLIHESIGEKQGLLFYEPHCEGNSRIQVGGQFTCWVTTLRARQTARLRFQRTGEAALQVVDVTIDGVAPEPDRELLEPLARAMLTSMAAGNYDALLERGSLQLQKKLDARRLSERWHPLQVGRGAVREIEWVDFTYQPDAGVARVEMRMVHAGRAYRTHVDFVPDRGEWRLLRINPAVDPDGESLRIGGRAVLESALREMTNDPSATLDCPWNDLENGDRSLTCAATAHGRRIAATTSPGPASATWIDLTTTDLATIVGMRIRRVETELGWTATSVDCGKGDLSRQVVTTCDVDSRQGDRRLSVRYGADDLQFVDLARTRG